MKRTLFNLGAIAMAFIIGLTINNACADSLGQTSDSELRNLVTQLQQEVKSLKQRVAELESKLGSSSGSPSSTGSGFDVDGIHFSKAGFPEDKIDRIVGSSYYINNGQRTDNETTTTYYEYDYKGRVQRANSQVYTYSDKSYKITYDIDSGGTKTHTEYTYYLK